MFTINSILQVAALASITAALANVLQRNLETTLAYFSAIAVLCLVSLLTFWVVYAVPASAFYLNCAFWIVAVLTIPIAVKSFQTDIAVATSLWVACTVGLLVWAFYPYNTLDVLDFAANRWSHPLPMDNKLPLIFAESILKGSVPSPMIGDWLSSDRPPLQTGFYLLTKLPYLDTPSSNIAYQLSATTAQMLIIPCSFMLLRAMGATLFVGVIGSASIFFTPVVLVNGLFVWPKLFPAALLCGVFGLHFFGQRKLIIEGIIVGMLSSMALLLHGGAMFSLIGFAATALIMRNWGATKYVISALLSVCILYLPWTYYQSQIDPPGNRLLKWHFAGAIPPDERTLTKAVADAYSAISSQELLDRKLANITMTASHPLIFFNAEKSADEIRKTAFFHLIPALGPLGVVAAISLLIGLFNSKTRTLSITFFATFCVWVLLMFDPASTVVHQASYFMVLSPLLLLFLLVDNRKILATLLMIPQVFLVVRLYM